MLETERSAKSDQCFSWVLSPNMLYLIGGSRAPVPLRACEEELPISSNQLRGVHSQSNFHGKYRRFWFHSFSSDGARIDVVRIRMAMRSLGRWSIAVDLLQLLFSVESLRITARPTIHPLGVPELPVYFLLTQTSCIRWGNLCRY